MPARRSAVACARTAMIAGTWSQTSMADLARCVGVSRQTLYNDFGSRDGLAQAVAEHTAEQFLTGARAAALAAPDDPVERIAAAASWAIAAAHEDLLIKASLTDDAGGLLPFLTTRSRDLLVPIATTIAAIVDHPNAAWGCEVALRLVVSHLLMPVRSDDEHVQRVADLIRPLLTEPAAQLPTPDLGGGGITTDPTHAPPAQPTRTRTTR